MKVSTEIKMMATLGVAGMLSGLLLVGVYLVTKPIIEQNRAEELQAAILEVLPGTVRTEARVLRGETLTQVERPEQGEAAVYAGYGAADEALGFAIPAEGGGFQDTIGLIYGFDPSTRRMTGMRVLQSLETPGLGDKIIKDQSFVGAFVGLLVDPEVVPVKKGDRQHDYEIDTISGATISSKAVVKIINKSNATWLPHIAAAGAGGDE